MRSATAVGDRELGACGASAVGERELRVADGIGEVCGVGLGDKDLRTAPLGHVLRKDLTSSAIGLVGDEQAVVGQQASEQGALAARSGTEVQRHTWSRAESAQHMSEKHGGCFLNIVGAGVQQRVGREDGSFLQIDTLLAPGYSAVGTCWLCIGRQALGIQANARGGFRIETTHEGGHIFLFPVAKEVLFEVFW